MAFVGFVIDDVSPLVLRLRGKRSDSAIVVGERISVDLLIAVRLILPGLVAVEYPTESPYGIDLGAVPRRTKSRDALVAFGDSVVGHVSYNLGLLRSPGHVSDLGLVCIEP